MKRNVDIKENLSGRESNDLMYTQSKSGAHFNKANDGPEVLISEWDDGSYIDEAPKKMVSGKKVSPINLNCRTEKNLKMSSFRDNRETHKPENPGEGKEEPQTAEQVTKGSMGKFESAKMSNKDKISQFVGGGHHGMHPTPQNRSDELRDLIDPEESFSGVKEDFSPFRLVETTQFEERGGKESSPFYNNYFGRTDPSADKLQGSLMTSTQEAHFKQQKENAFSTLERGTCPIKKDVSKTVLTLTKSSQKTQPSPFCEISPQVNLLHDLEERVNQTLSISSSHKNYQKLKNDHFGGIKENHGEREDNEYNAKDFDGDGERLLDDHPKFGAKNRFKTFLGEIKKFDPFPKIKKVDDNPRKKLMAFLKNKRRGLEEHQEHDESQGSGEANPAPTETDNTNQSTVQKERGAINDENSRVLISTQRYQDSETIDKFEPGLDCAGSQIDSTTGRAFGSLIGNTMDSGDPKMFKKKERSLKLFFDVSQSSQAQNRLEERHQSQVLLLGSKKPSLNKSGSSFTEQLKATRIDRNGDYGVSAQASRTISTANINLRDNNSKKKVATLLRNNSGQKSLKREVSSVPALKSLKKMIRNQLPGSGTSRRVPRLSELQTKTKEFVESKLSGRCQLTSRVDSRSRSRVENHPSHSREFQPTLQDTTLLSRGSDLKSRECSFSKAKYKLKNFLNAPERKVGKLKKQSTPVNPEKREASIFMKELPALGYSFIDLKKDIVMSKKKSKKRMKMNQQHHKPHPQDTVGLFDEIFASKLKNELLRLNRIQDPNSVSGNFEEVYDGCGDIPRPKTAGMHKLRQLQKSLEVSSSKKRKKLLDKKSVFRRSSNKKSREFGSILGSRPHTNYNKHSSSKMKTGTKRRRRGSQDPPINCSELLQTVDYIRWPETRDADHSHKKKMMSAINRKICNHFGYPLTSHHNGNKNHTHNHSKPSKAGEYGLMPGYRAGRTKSSEIIEKFRESMLRPKGRQMNTSQPPLGRIEEKRKSRLNSQNKNRISSEKGLHGAEERQSKRPGGGGAKTSININFSSLRRTPENSVGPEGRTGRQRKRRSKKFKQVINIDSNPTQNNINIVIDEQSRSFSRSKASRTSSVNHGANNQNQCNHGYKRKRSSSKKNRVSFSSLLNKSRHNRTISMNVRTMIEESTSKKRMARPPSSGVLPRPTTSTNNKSKQNYGSSGGQNLNTSYQNHQRYRPHIQARQEVSQDGTRQELQAERSGVARKAYRSRGLQNLKKITSMFKPSGYVKSGPSYPFGGELPKAQFFDQSPRRVNINFKEISSKIARRRQNDINDYSLIEKTQEMINKKFQNLETTLNKSKIKFDSFLE